MQNPHRKLVQRIREEFEHIPGLRLTLDEASSFLALDQATCRRVFADLSHEGFLARGVDGRFQQPAA